MNTSKEYELSILRTKLSNQRTYLLYIQAGFVLASIAGMFKKKMLIMLGIIIIIFSSMQYYYISNKLKNKEVVDTRIIDNIPLLFIFISITVLYLQFIKK